MPVSILSPRAQTDMGPGDTASSSAICSSVMNDQVEAEMRGLGQLRRHRTRLRAARMSPPCQASLSQRHRFFQPGDREGIGIGQCQGCGHQAMAVGIGLHHRHDAASRGTVAYRPGGWHVTRRCRCARESAVSPQHALGIGVGCEVDDHGIPIVLVRDHSRQESLGAFGHVLKTEEAFAFFHAAAAPGDQS